MNVSNVEEGTDPMVLATDFIMYKIGEVFNQAYFPVLVPVGIVGNILSFLEMIQPHNRHMSFSLYISALAVSDTFVLVIAFIRYLNQVHEIIPPSHQRTFCRAVVPAIMGGTMWSAHLVVFMTFERFYSIIQPHKAASFNTVKRAKITITFIFVFGFLFNMPYAFIGDNTGTFCIVQNDIARSLPGQIFYWLHFSVSFAMPFVFMITMNTVIIHTLRKRSEWVTTQGQGQGQSTKRQSSERQIYVILLLVAFGFLILTTPAYAMLIWINFTTVSTPYFFAAYHLFTNIAEKSYYTNNGINFFLYIMSGKKFRADLMKLLNCVRKKNAPFGSNSDDLKTVTSTISVDQ